MMNPMAVALPDLGPHRVIVSLPRADVADLVPACEVLWQEGFRTWALHTSQLADLAELKPLFGRRAVLGVEGLDSASQATAALDAGAAFLAAPRVVRGLAAVGAVAPVILGGLTPSEVLAAAEAGATAVQIIPCDALSTVYAASIRRLAEGVSLIATGELTPTAARTWLSCGAVGVWTTGLATVARIVDVDLDGLRIACRSWQS